MNIGHKVPSRTNLGYESLTRPQHFRPSLKVISVALLALILFSAFLVVGMDFSIALPLSILLGLTGEPFIELMVTPLRVDLFAPRTLVAGYFMLYFGIRAIWLQFGNAIRLGRNPYDDFLPAALWCACLGYISFAAGLAWNHGRNATLGFFKRELSWPRSIPQFRILTLLVIGLLGLLYLFSIGFVVGAGIADLSQKPKAIAIFMETLLEMAWIAIWIGLLRRRSLSTRPAAWFLLLLCAVLLGLRTAMLGTKITLIAPVIEAMIVFHYMKRRLRLWQLVAVAVPTAILTFGLLNFYRFVVVGQTTGSPASAADFTNRLSAASDYLIRSGKEHSGQSPPLDQLVNRSTGVDALALIIKYTPNPNPFAYGRDLLQLPLALIPRQLWKGKPHETGGSYFETSYEGLPPSFTGATSIQLISDVYRNFYLFGVVGGMFLIGASLRYMYFFCSPYRANPAGIFFYAAVLPVQVHCFEQTTEAAIGWLIQFGIVLVAAGYFLGVHLRSQPKRAVSKVFQVPQRQRLSDRARHSRHWIRVGTTLISFVLVAFAIPAIPMLLGSAPIPHLGSARESRGGIPSAGNSAVPIEQVTNILSFGAKPNDPTSNCRAAFQDALTVLSGQGGGTLYLPRGEYYIDFPDIASDADPRSSTNLPVLRSRNLAKAKLILVPPAVTLLGDIDQAGNPTTRIHWKETSFPLLSFVNSDHSGIKNIAFVFDGFQPQFFPWSQEQYLDALGVNTAYVGGPYELSTVIYTIGSEGLTFEALTFESGAKPADNQHTFAYGIVSKGKGPIPRPGRQLTSQLAIGAKMSGPALSGSVRGNIFRSLKFNDFICGILASGQESPVFDTISGHYRGSWYRSFDPDHEESGKTDRIPGPGHLIYITAQPTWEIARSLEHAEGIPVIHGVVRNTNVTIRNITESAETLSNFNSLGTLALKNIDGGIVQNVHSQHPAGLIVSLADVHNVMFQDLTWHSTRNLCLEPEAKLTCGIPAIQLVPDSYPGLEGFNDQLTFKNVDLRSPCCAPIFKISATQTQDSSKMNHNIVVAGLNIESSPKPHNGQTSARAMIEVQAANVHFTGVTYTPVTEGGLSATLLAHACQILPKSTDVTIGITIHRTRDFPSSSDPVYKCAIAEHAADNDSAGMKNGCAITRNFVN